jgi:hypothetical protein
MLFYDQLAAQRNHEANAQASANEGQNEDSEQFQRETKEDQRG